MGTVRQTIFSIKPLSFKKYLRCATVTLLSTLQDSVPTPGHCDDVVLIGLVPQTRPTTSQNQPLKIVPTAVTEFSPSTAFTPKHNIKQSKTAGNQEVFVLRFSVIKVKIKCSLPILLLYADAFLSQTGHILNMHLEVYI